MYSDQNRAFNYAVVASLVLHGLLLFALPGLKDSSKRQAPLGPIIARLVEPQSAAPAPQVEPPKPRVEPPKPQARETPVPPPAPRKPQPSLKPVPKAESRITTPPAPAAPTAEPAPAAPPAPAGPSAPPTVAKVDPIPGSAPAPGPATPQAPAMDEGSLAQYRLQLISAARKYKRYPRVAMDNNWEGDVVVRMVIGANGMISALSIKASSGHEVLDQQALDMFKKAKPLVQIPPALRGREFIIELRAIYNLKDQDSG